MNLFESIIDLPYGDPLTESLLEAYDELYGIFEAVDYDVQQMMDMTVLNFTTPSGSEVDVTLTPAQGGAVDVAFSTQGTYEDTGKGDIAVVRQALAAVLDYFQKKGYPKELVFTPFKGAGDYDKQAKSELENSGDFVQALQAAMQFAEQHKARIPGAGATLDSLKDLRSYSRFGNSIIGKTVKTANDVLYQFGEEVKPYLDALKAGYEKMISIGDVNRRKNIYQQFIRRACPSCQMRTEIGKGGLEKIYVKP